MKKKRLIIIILLVVGIVCIIFANFTGKKVNLKEEFESITYTYQGNSRSFFSYDNFFYIKNDSDSDKTIFKIKVEFYDSNKKIIEEIFLEIGTISKNQEIQKQFKSKNNLTKAVSFTVSYDNVVSIEDEYNDNTIFINDFVETDDRYLFNLKNVSDKKIVSENLTIEFLDEDNNVVLSKEFAFELNSLQTTTISTLKGGINLPAIKYIKILEY